MYNLPTELSRIFTFFFKVKEFKLDDKVYKEPFNTDSNRAHASIPLILVLS